MDAIIGVLGLVVPVIVIVFTALFPIAAFARGKWGAKSRVDLIGGGLDALVVLIIGRFIVPWDLLTPWAWFIPVGIVAAGAAGRGAALGRVADVDVADRPTLARS